MIGLKKLAIMMAVLAAVTLGTGTAFAANLVTNGDFELGNTGFSSDYLYFAQPAVPASGYTTPKSSLYDEGTYGVGTDPALYHANWASFGDHTSGEGNMMIVNGATDASGVNVLTMPLSPGTIPVAPNTTYFFSAWLTSNIATNESNLEFSINGDPLGAPIQLAAAPGTWELFYREWNSGANLTAQLSLIDINEVANGNDFAIDDISFDTTNPVVPIPGAVWLLGSGLLGLVAIRRRMSK